MNIYLAIKYHPDAQNRPLIETISAVLATQGHTTICIARDVEQWGAVQLPPARLMQRAFQAIDNSDQILIELSEKGVGLGIEAGYAHALGKPITVIAPPTADLSNTLQGIAATVFRYTNIDELAHVPWPPSAALNLYATWEYAVRSVDRLLLCLDDLTETELNWRPLPTANTLYALTTHMLGNIQETVYGVICQQPVTRARAAEFAAQGSNSSLLRAQWQELQGQIQAILYCFTAAELARPRLHPRRGALSANEILTVVARHAAEHLAQAEFTRDLLLAMRQGKVELLR